jgi:antitoxin ParD1/3/4
MRIAIDLPPRLEGELRDAIARHDESKVEKVLAAAVRPTVEMLLGAPAEDLTDEEFEELADRLADEAAILLGPNVPKLPDEALTREGIYGDHP